MELESMNPSDYFTRFLGIVTSEWFTKLVGVVGGISGTALGIYNLIASRQKEKRSRRGQEEDWQRYIWSTKEPEGRIEQIPSRLK